MFDKTTLVIGDSRTMHHHTKSEVNVHEHRAPTDDSIRLYREMEEKAHRNLLTTIQAGNNTFEIKAVALQAAIGPGWNCLYAYTLNGKEYQGELKLQHRDLYAGYKEEIIGKVYDQAAKQMAAELIQQLMAQRMLP